MLFNAFLRGHIFSIAFYLDLLHWLHGPLFWTTWGLTRWTRVCLMLCSCSAGCWRYAAGSVILFFLIALSTQFLNTQQSSVLCPIIRWYRQKSGWFNLPASYGRLHGGNWSPHRSARWNISVTLSFLNERVWLLHSIC
jgi:hypothetical protein